jgi:GNAT superfamily N-acetyltransferase
MRCEPDPRTATHERLVVALAHPSLEVAVAVFARQMRCEQRFFGTAAPKLPRSSLENLTTQGGIRLGVMVDHRLVAMSRVDHDGSAIIAVVQQHRGRGIGRQLLQTTLRRAARHGHRCVTFRSSRRSKAFIRLAESTGATVVDHDRGCTELIFAVDHATDISSDPRPAPWVTRRSGM